MPEISHFYGIVVKMYYNDHAPPHFHAEYGRSEIVIAIDTLGVIAGKLPPRATGLVLEWAALHQGDLRSAWTQARQMQPIDRIDPLA
jgi:hypothetical protein